MIKMATAIVPAVKILFKLSKLAYTVASEVSRDSVHVKSEASSRDSLPNVSNSRSDENLACTFCKEVNVPRLKYSRKEKYTEARYKVLC